MHLYIVLKTNIRLHCLGCWWHNVSELLQLNMIKLIKIQKLIHLIEIIFLLLAMPVKHIQT